MADGYTKLFSDIVDSSIWDESPETCKVWVTLLALSNADGLVRGSVGWLSAKARVTVRSCELALKKFELPDVKSRTPDNDGRRIEVLEDGWLILNYLLFRDRLSMNPIAVKTRERVRKHRERYNALRNGKSVTPAHSASASGSVPVPGGCKGGSRFEKPTMPEMELYASKLAFPVLEIQKFYDYYESNGWRVGRNPMKSWQAAMRNWKNNLSKFSTTNGHGDSFWKNTKELELVEKEIAAIKTRATQTATSSVIDPKDRESFDRLRARRSEIKSKLQLK